MRQAKRMLWIILILGVVLPFLTLLIPAPAHLRTLRPEEFRGSMAASVWLAWLHFGTAALFIMGLEGFKAGLKRAYAAICTGLVIFGLSLLQLPLLVSLNLLESRWSTLGGVLPTIAYLMIFWGLCRFAAVIGIAYARNLSIVVPIAAVCAAILGGIIVDAKGFNIGFASPIADSMFTATSAVLALRIKQTAGPAYTNALAWFFLCLAIIALGSVIQVIAIAANHIDVPILIIPYCLGAVLFVKAGYAFNKVKEY